MADNLTFGYIRVSAKDQNENRQIDSLMKYVSEERYLYIDKASGKSFERPQYQALKTTLRSGDMLYIHSLDRLGRNKVEIKKELQELTDKGVTIRILDIPTTMMDFSQFGALQTSIMDMINNLLIEVLATVAESELIRNKERQQEGITAAKARNVKFGRPVKNFPDSWPDDYKIWKAGEVTAVSLMKKYGISKTAFYSKVKEYEAGK